MIPFIILSILLIAVGISFFGSVLAGFIPSTTKNTKNTKIKKLISTFLPAGGKLEPNQSIQSQDGSYTLKNEGNRLVLFGPEGEVVKEWPYVSGDPVLSVSGNGDVYYGETIIHQSTDNSTEYSLGVTNEGNLELSNGNGSSEIIGLTWTQLGLDIPGVNIYDHSGRSVSLSSDGNIVAIGAPYNDNNNYNNSGHVRVFEYKDEDGDGKKWLPLGGDIVGAGSGWSVSLSSDGNTVAIGDPYNNNFKGCVRVYRYNGSSWAQLGSDIDDAAAGDESGYSVSLSSSDGNIVAVGAPGNINDPHNNIDKGRVRVYQYTEANGWSRLGGDIDDAASGDHSGFSVSLSSDGNTVAIGAPRNNNNGGNNGRVRVYRYNGNSWTQLVGYIDGVAYGDRSGYSVSLSSNGNIVAIGAPYNDNNNYNNSGHVRVFEYKTIDGQEVWKPLGSDIPGAAGGDRSGWSVSLSSDGKIVAIGAPYKNIYNAYPPQVYSGHVRVFKYNGSSWTQLGSDIDGEAAGDYSGYSVSLSSDGKTVAIGSPFNDNGTVYDIGRTKVYKLI